MLNVAEFESYQALIFDMDGTIIDSMPSHAKAWKLVGETMGYSLNENIMYQLGGASVYKIAQHIMQEANMPLELIDEVVKLKREYGKQLLLSETTLLPTVDIIRHFFGHKPMALGTGSHQVITDLLLKKFNLQHYFNAIVTSDDVQYHKPAPDTFLRCAELLQVQPQHCVVFEDADLGVQAGLAAGMAVFDVRINQFVKR